MMNEKAKRGKRDESLVIEVHEGRVNVCLLGTTPYLSNSMSMKAMQTILYPPGRKNATERATTIKHDPVREFRDSLASLPAADEPTWIAHPATGFKKALGTAALDLPGTKKAQIGRLVHVVGPMIGLYGLPLVHMAPVRSADINRTPDIRTRAILAEWACYLSIRYVTPIITESLVVRVLAAAGLYIGVGDFRSEKGAGDHGCFRICAPDDPDFGRLVKTAGRAAQLAAIETPRPYDQRTEDLWHWYETEVERRGRGPTRKPTEPEPVEFDS